jgi:hypothetical protein
MDVGQPLFSKGSSNKNNCAKVSNNGRGEKHSLVRTQHKGLYEEGLDGWHKRLFKFGETKNMLFGRGAKNICYKFLILK